MRLINQRFRFWNTLRPFRKKEIWGLSMSLLIMNLAAIVEKADDTLLPAVYKEVSQTFKVGPSQLGFLTFTYTFLQALSSPLAGISAMRYHRASIVGIATIFWAFSAAAIAMSQTFTYCVLWRTLSAISVAFIIPALQSFVADSCSDRMRGTAFGILSLVGALGSIGGSMLSTMMAGYTFGGLSGWRFTFLFMASLGLLIGLLVHNFVIDHKMGVTRSPLVYNHHSRKHEDDGKSASSYPSTWGESWDAVKEVLKLRTFQVLVLQGLFGTLPWTAMVFFTMWLQLIGFSHKRTAILIGIFKAGCALGSLLGGWISDKASRRYPVAGRIMCAQFSSFMGIPFSWLLLIALPHSPDNFVYFAATFLSMGLTISWCQACANNPIFAEIVPMSHRTIIYAFDRAFEGSFPAIAAPIVGLVAEKYGYRSNMEIPESGSGIEAYALSRGLFAMMAAPFGFCCLFYSLLYVTYKSDRDKANHHKPLSAAEDTVLKLAFE